jgi:hypothetical protein
MGQSDIVGEWKSVEMITLGEERGGRKRLRVLKEGSVC